MVADADRVARALRAAHCCPPDCPGCRRENDEAGGPRLARFRHLVTGSLALRLAHAKAEYGIPIPSHVWTDDPLEQWLLEEAIMTHFHETGRADAALQRAHADAAATRKQLLAEHRERMGYA